ncbi:hypothetical protein KGA66_24400 [Actinocrinis puniceicyclus]|uniref:LamG-like jellyroll fold domain-containing protein n=1 Tax=Actinocrinis puniceicyclus TaxID=977794 RepID=A0A8J7WPL3_9ACTN|nr:LamG-like jellyroll fold domain-containing protein [Actinocrinis puniceicyclus]MBS2966208.1 hypothetical protein [Actinocrinis puniceicyclus]
MGLSRRLARITAMMVVFALSVVAAMGSADAAVLPRTTVKLSSVEAFVKSLFADEVGLPRQVSGTAAGKGGQVPTAVTRAGKGVGRPPGKGVGELPAFSPSVHRTAAGKSAAAHAGFDAKTSKRNARKSNAVSDWYDNADGSYTVKTSQAPVNFKAADGTWQPIDATLVRGAGGRLQQRSNRIGVSFAGGGAAAGSALSGTQSGLAGPRTARSSSASVPAQSAGELVSVSLGASQRFGWSLSGAASVDPVTSGSTAEYDAILPDTDLALTSESWGVKETFTLAGKSAPNSWTFPLSLSGVSVKDDPAHGWELVDGSGSVIGRLSVPFAYDSVVARGQHPHTTYAVTYRLSTDASGAQSLVMTLNKAWLDDPARVFPVTVDPTMTVGDAGVRASTYIEYPFSNNYSSTGQLLSGYSDWSSPTVKARSFIYFDSMPVALGYHVTQANLGIFDVWAASCSAEPFDVYPVIDPNWTIGSINTQLTWNNTTYTGPSVGSSMGEVSASPGAACSNTGGDPSTGAWMYPQLNTNVVNQWTSTNAGSYHGIEIAAPNESNDLEWKIFDSTAISANSPYIYLTYTPNVVPQVNSTSPVSGYNSPTLTPTLSASASDSDNWPNIGLGYEYRVFDGANDQKVADSNPGAHCLGGTKPSSGASWTVPAGALKWGQSYYWSVAVCDGDDWSGWAASSALVAAVPPPLLTSSLSQNTSGHGFDPALGNYTKSATDAQVASAGPTLAVTRDYNSLDPRTTQAFGGGWSSLLDARATEVRDGSGTNVVSVKVTYPDGSEVGFGKNSDGSFAPPLGRFATLAAVSDGYTLTDKNDTVYSFTHQTATGSGDYQIGAVTDAAGRRMEVRYSATTGGLATRYLSDVSSRSIYFSWSSPSGNISAHVKTAYTDPVTSGGVTAPLTWTYRYNGNQLSEVCPPTSTACTGYQYQQTTSQYRTALLDGGPTAYWPLSEASGPTAGDLVLANEQSKDATYSAAGVGYGVAGPLAGSTATGVSLDGSSGSIALPRNLVTGTTYLTMSLWFKTATTSSYGPLLCEQDVALPGTPKYATCSLYVGTDGKLHGEWYAASGQMVSTVAVNDAQWHHVVLVGAGNSQQLYLDGSTSKISGGPLSGQINNLTQGYEYVGAGYNSSTWPGTPATAGNWYFPGSVSDVAFSQSALPAATVAQLNTSGTTAIPMLTAITRPSGNEAAHVTYSTVTGRVTSVVDENGGTWGVQAPTVFGSAEGYRAAVMGSAPSGYWRLGDPPGALGVHDEVAADKTAMIYYGTPTLGASGPLNASQSAATFDGTSQHAATGSAVLDTSKSFSVSAWANLASTSGFQDVVAQDGSQDTGFELQYDATDSAWAFARTATDTASPVGIKVHASSKPSTGTWYHLVGVFNASGGKNTMSLYVNGKLAGSGTDSTPFNATGSLEIGRGKYSGSPSSYFNGSIAEVAVSPSALDGATIAAMYAAGKNASGLNPTETVTVTDPASKTLTYEYDPVNGGRPVAQIDALGAKTTFGYDTSGFLHTVVDPNGDETITGHDVRGNTVSRTTCQNQATNSCSTSYYTYFPNDATAQLTTADPRNDMLLTASDARSSSSSDTTYRTTYAYDKFGDRTSLTTPPVAGYPAGRTASTVFTDGTITYPASDDQTKPVPAGLPWKQTSAGGSVTQYNYYADGDLYSTVSPTGNMTTTFTYDALGRPTTKVETYNTGAPCTNLNGSIVCPAPVSLTTTTVYDGLNRAVTVTAPATMDRVTGDTHQAQTTTVYDVDDNQTSQTIADVGGSTVPDTARTTVQHYDSHDRVDWSMDAQQTVDGNGTSSSPDLTKATQYSYDAYGNKVRVVSPQDQNGRSAVSDYTYDPNGRLLYLTLEGYTGSPSGSQPAANQTLEAHTYDPAGRLASATDAMGVETDYLYYDNDQTAEVTRCRHVVSSGGGGTCSGGLFVQESDSYDAAGHLIKSLTNNGTTETDHAYDAAGRQTSSTLDPHGLNRTTAKTYNADDLVVSQRTGDAVGSGTTDYQYNADGAMTAQSVENYTTGAPNGWWKLNDGAAGATTPVTARDWSGQNDPGTLNSGVAWTSGAASFNGTSGSITTGAPAINTAASYSVSAWVNASSGSSNFTVLSQSGNSASAFQLQNDATTNAWRFAVSNTDSTTTTHTGVEASANSLATGVWTLLTATVDLSLMTMKLYVNGAAVGSATLPGVWNATGPVVVAAGKVGGAMTQFFPGQVANVQVYQRVLGPSDVQTLYADGNGRTGGALSAPSNTTAWALDGRDLPTSMTDAKGLTTDYVYDEAGHRAVTQEPAVAAGTYSASGGYTQTSQPAAPIKTTGYDTFGDALESKDPTGVEAITSFDADGRATATKLPDYQQPGSVAGNNQLLTGESQKTQYNELGQKTATWDPAGVETDFAYDQLGHQTGETQDVGGANQLTTTAAYDLSGETLQVNDPTGNIQAATYDFLGRTVTTTQVLGRGGSGSIQIPTGCSEYNNVATQAACTTNYTYSDTAGYLSQVTSPSGVGTSYGYDAAGERTGVTDAANQTTTTGYDYAGRAVKTTLPDGTYTTSVYDQAGQVTAQSQYDASGALLRASGTTYDADGNVQSTTDPNGNTTHFNYDDVGRLASESQPASYTSSLSQVPSVTQTITTSFGYDLAGRQTEYVTGGVGPSGTPSYWYTTYNSRGLSESTIAPPTATYTSPADSTTTVTYDADGRPVEQDSPGGVVRTVGYDPLGEVTNQGGSSTNAADAPTATRQFTYYANGLMKTASTTSTATSGSNATSESFTYDDSGALASASGSAGTSAFAYTADGQMASRTDTIGGTAYTTGYGYDSAGRLSTIADPLTGSTLTYAYTANSPDYGITYGTGGNVRSFHFNAAHELASDTLKTPGGGQIVSIGYGYDANGNETSKTTTGFTGAAANTYTYDQANRLKSWNNGTTVTGYSYDQDGNRTNVAGNTYTYDARDELTSDGTNTYGYTARGTLVSTTSASGTSATATDAFGQMQADGTDSYTYDALGRVVQHGNTAFDYTGTGNTLSYDGYTTYSRDPSGGLVADKQPTYGAWLDLTDRHQDVVAYFGPTSTDLVGSVAYDPLGKILSKVGHSTGLGYQSEYYSQSTGKVNMAARWYNPATGEFTGKDSASNNPVPNSANANPFAYGNDNPLTSTDPSGHRACPADGQCFGTVNWDHGASNEARSYRDWETAQARTPSHQIISQYASNEFDRCGARMGCFVGRLKALQSIKIGKDGHTLTGNPAAVADLNSVIKDLFGSGDGSADGSGGGNQHKQCNWNPMTWGGCAHNAAVWVAKHPLIQQIVTTAVGVIAGGLCTLATDGAAVAGCAALGGAVANGLNYAITADATGKGSLAGFVGSVAVGAATGWAAAATGGVAAGMIKSAFGADAAASLLGRAAIGTVSGAAGGAVFGGGSYLNACSDTGGCSVSGFVDATGTGMAVGAVGGGAFGAIGAVGAGRGAGASEAEAARSEGEASGARTGSGCMHSFAGETGVLMADGSSKPIDQIKVGDKITDAAPGGVSEIHTVERVIVTTTDHDFAALTIAPVRSVGAGAAVEVPASVGKGLAAGSGTRTKFAGAALAAALVLAPASGAAAHQVAGPRAAPAATANLTTTYHHAFYDVSTNQWTEAEHLRAGDLLQTPTGYAVLDAVHLYHANTVTYDLTIGALHTYYVVAGSTPVLVHNCTEGEEGSPTAAEPTKLYRAPHAGNKDAEEFGLDPANHPAQGRHPGTAYLGDTEGVAQQYAAQGIYEDGYWEYTMKPEFESEFPADQYRVPHDNKPGEYQWIIPQGEIPRFNNLIQGSRWINYYEGYTW